MQLAEVLRCICLDVSKSFAAVQIVAHEREEREFAVVGVERNATVERIDSHEVGIACIDQKCRIQLSAVFEVCREDTCGIGCFNPVQAFLHDTLLNLHRPFRGCQTIEGSHQTVTVHGCSIVDPFRCTCRERVGRSSIRCGKRLVVDFQVDCCIITVDYIIGIIAYHEISLALPVLEADARRHVEDAALGSFHLKWNRECSLRVDAIHGNCEGILLNCNVIFVAQCAAEVYLRPRCRGPLVIVFVAAASGKSHRCHQGNEQVIIIFFYHLCKILLVFLIVT